MPYIAPEVITEAKRMDLLTYLREYEPGELVKFSSNTYTTRTHDSFGLWIYNTDRNGDVRCLCPKCLSDYIHDPNYIVRRLDPFAKSKDHCDKCNNSGWDYIVYDKRTSVKGKGCRNVK